MTFRLFDFEDLFAADDRSSITFSVLPLRFRDASDSLFSAGCKSFETCPDKPCRKNSAVSPFSGTHIARMDIVEGKDECTVKVELPGIEKQDIQVHFDDATQVLTVEAERRGECTGEGTEKDRNASAASLNSECRHKKHCFHQERFYGHIKRAIRLPDSVDGQNATASLSDGILKLVFARKPEKETRRSISIN